MSTVIINNHADLLAHIRVLKLRKKQEEQQLKESFRSFFEDLNPVNIVKDSLHELAKDKQVKFDITKFGLKVGADFLIEKVLGKNRSIKGFMGSELVEQLTAGFIDKQLGKAAAFLSKDEEDLNK